MSLCRDGDCRLRTHLCIHKSIRDSPESASVPWRAWHGPLCPKKQRKMTLEGVCGRSGAYDNTRSV